jgi:CRP-like cAMP-binding protein
MAPAQASGTFSRNILLGKLPSPILEVLQRHLQRVPLEVPQPICEPNRPFEHVYFPEDGMISVVSIMSNGDSIEVGTIGREGVAGAFLLMGAKTTPYRYFVQVPGEAQRIDAGRFMELAEQHEELRDISLRYQMAFLTQSMQGAACNGLHNVQQRCCRWLLMARDRSNSDEIALTHEFLALMLGTRRASVTEVLRPLQETGLVSSNRGRITILNRAGLEKGSCECYRIIRAQLEAMLGI